MRWHRRLAVSLAGFAAACSGGSGSDDTAAETAAQDPQDQSVEWLFIQNAESVSLADGVLTLRGVSPTTLFFSDRPERIAGHGLTAEFVTFWQQASDDGFGADPPNATLAIVTEDEANDIVLTLM
ncbi:MAG: hypothetical protein WBP17_01850, partial [Gemmatimonadota bacterium]